MSPTSRKRPGRSEEEADRPVPDELLGTTQIYAEKSLKTARAATRRFG
jgi:hypothetical protein